MSRSSGSSRLGRCGLLLGVSAALALAAVGAASAATGTWNIARVGAPVTGDGALVAVVDSGVDAGHAAFGGRVVGQEDLVGDDQEGDPNGHGTHVAGTVAGGDLDCGSGPAAIGVAPSARILSVRVLDPDGQGSVSDVADGIRYAADRGAAVINLSLGPEIAIVGGGGSFADALDYAWSKGSIPVLAAGNDGLLGSLLGSSYGDVPAVVVTATTRSDRKASYATSVGSAPWGISGPGGDGGGTAEGDVVSAWPDARCGILAGTSMAAPHVSGALAVLRGRGLSPQEAVDRVLATADPIGPRSTYGAGLVDLGRALEGLGEQTPPPPGQPEAPPDEHPPATTPSRSGPDEVTPGPGREAPRSATTAGASQTTGAAPAPTTTTTSGPEEAAAGLSTVRDEDDRRAGGPLVVAAGLAAATGWALTGRAAFVLRR